MVSNVVWAGASIGSSKIIFSITIFIYHSGFFLSWEYPATTKQINIMSFFMGD
jgi:hypothetical protein